MGTFTLMDFDEIRRSRHHKRTTRYVIQVSIEDREQVKVAVESEKNAPWNGEEININVAEGYSAMVLVYGPVHGAYKSDLTRFLKKHNIQPTYIGSISSTHVDDDTCRNGTHKGIV
jgi:hypothetical protein